MTLTPQSDGCESGTATLGGTEQLPTNGSCSASQIASVPVSLSLQVTGTASALAFTGMAAATQPLTSGFPATFMRNVNFTGTLTGASVTGTVTYHEDFAYPSGSTSGSGSADIPVALH